MSKSVKVFGANTRFDETEIRTKQGAFETKKQRDEERKKNNIM